MTTMDKLAQKRLALLPVTDLPVKIDFSRDHPCCPVADHEIFPARADIHPGFRRVEVGDQGVADAVVEKIDFAAFF